MQLGDYPNQESDERMIAADAHAYAVAKDNPQAEIFLWLVIIAVIAMIAHAIYRFINRE